MYGRIRVVVRGAFFPAQFHSRPIVYLASLHKWLLLYLVLDYNSKRRWALPIPAISNVMAAISIPDYQPKIHDLAKRSNWASKNPGVILVFVIVFIVIMGVVLLFLYRRMLRKKAEKQAYSG